VYHNKKNKNKMSQKNQMNLSDLISTSDIAAAAVGAGYSSVFNLGKPGMMALQSFIISVAARMVSKQDFNMLGMEKDQKNQLIVGALGAAVAYSKNGSVPKGAISQVSIDLMAEDIMRLLRVDDGNFFDFNGSKKNGSSTEI
jgi:hypothetical protein